MTCGEFTKERLADLVAKSTITRDGLKTQEAVDAEAELRDHATDLARECLQLRAEVRRLRELDRSRRQEEEARDE